MVSSATRSFSLLSPAKTEASAELRGMLNSEHTDNLQVTSSANSLLSDSASRAAFHLEKSSYFRGEHHNFATHALPQAMDLQLSSDTPPFDATSEAPGSFRSRITYCAMYVSTYAVSKHYRPPGLYCLFLPYTMHSTERILTTSSHSSVFRSELVLVF